MKIIKRASFRTMPWKNSGGTTIEVAVSPDGASMDNFDWRVSMAHVASDGPFSSFPGIDRSLTLLEGAGMMLRIEGQGDVHLTTQSPPLAFPGDVATLGQLTDGPILDLNVMTRRGVCRAAVAISAEQEQTVPSHRVATLVLVRGGGAQCSIGDLDDGDALVLKPADPSTRLHLDKGAKAYTIGID